MLLCILKLCVFTATPPRQALFTCAAASHELKTLKPEASAEVGVNMNNFDQQLIQNTPVSIFDGANTWTYSTMTTRMTKRVLPRQWAVGAVTDTPAPGG
jgi:hypothetical protein